MSRFTFAFSNTSVLIACVFSVVVVPIAPWLCRLVFILNYASSIVRLRGWSCEECWVWMTTALWQVWATTQAWRRKWTPWTWLGLKPPPPWPPKWPGMARKEKYCRKKLLLHINIVFCPCIEMIYGWLQKTEFQQKVYVLFPFYMSCSYCWWVFFIVTISAFMKVTTHYCCHCRTKSMWCSPQGPDQQTVPPEPRRGQWRLIRGVLFPALCLQGQRSIPIFVELSECLTQLSLFFSHFLYCFFCSSFSNLFCLPLYVLG